MSGREAQRRLVVYGPNELAWLEIVADSIGTAFVARTERASLRYGCDAGTIHR